MTPVTSITAAILALVSDKNLHLWIRKNHTPFWEKVYLRNVEYAFNNHPNAKFALSTHVPVDTDNPNYPTSVAYRLNPDQAVWFWGGTEWSRVYDPTWNKRLIYALTPNKETPPNWVPNEQPSNLCSDETKPYPWTLV